MMSPPYDKHEPEEQLAEGTLISHLLELRSRMMKAVVAVAFVFLGELNAASASFTALLMGLGTDFTIVMYARYIEERQAGRSLTHATELMVGETGLGVFTGVITSAGTFFAMCFSRFKGLDDLGFLIGGGILLCKQHSKSPRLSLRFSSS